MKRVSPLLGILLLVSLGACSTIWAQALSRQMADALLSMESYHGTLEQVGLLPDAPDQPVVQDVWYQTPWRIRAEISEPAALSGTLFVFDGEQLKMWWPSELLGIRVRGLVNPGRDEVVVHLAREISRAMEHYAFALQENHVVAGHPVKRWQVIPLDREAPWRLDHVSWNHSRYTLPLQMDFSREGEPWYSYRFRDITFDVPVPDDTFSFEFPENALVLEWDMQAPGMTLEKARRSMNFDVLQPSSLPDGHQLQKIVPGASCLPMLAMDFSRGASVITMTQSRAWGPDQVPRFGKPVDLGHGQAWLYFAGSYTVLNWVQGRTLVTLMGNLSFPQLIEVARSVR